MDNSKKTMDKIVALCKTRGFIFPGSEIYGGLANSWDYGPLGVEFKNNVKRAWWKKFVQESRYNVGLDAAIIMNPELIVADEPVSALDVSIQAQVINLLNELRDKFGLTILFIAHDLSVVKYFSDRIGVMYFGKMVELADSDELFRHPLHPYTKSLLSAIPLPDPKTEKNRKRIVYNALAEHDYSVDKPSMREVAPGHFVYCNDEEFARYTEEVKA